MTSFVEYVSSRTAIMMAGLNFGLDAISKSLRSYSTRVHPALQERLQHHFNHMSLNPFRRGKTFNYEMPSGPMSGSQVMNLCFQSFYEQEQRSGEEDILYCKLSSKTADDESDVSMLESTKQWAQSLKPDGAEYVDLRILAQDHLGPTTSWELCERFPSSTFTVAVINFLEENQWQFPCDRRVRVPGRSELIPDLRMSVKYYESRDDNRAYCHDHNRLRSLVGAMLHRLICPKQKKVRRSLQSSGILRPDDKDILQLRVKREVVEDRVTLLILGDISNFTGSLGNAWLMLFCMALDISSEPMNLKRNLFAVGDTLISATWHDVVAIYLYLTVGMPIWVEERSSYSFLPGGYLGVNGNITIGLLFLALVMQYVLKAIQRFVYDADAQAGGDDHAFLITCDIRDQERITNLITYHMKNYVGHMKEFAVIDIDNLPEGIIPDVTFCRKRIVVKRDSQHTFLHGEVTFPIPVASLPTHVVPVKDRQKAWVELDLAMKSYEERVGDPHRLCDAFRYAFLRRYPAVRPVRVTITKWWSNTVPLVQYGSYSLTPTAVDTVQSIRIIHDTYHSALLSDESRIRHALHVQLLVPHEVYGAWTGTTTVLISANEQLPPLLSSTRDTVWRSPYADLRTCRNLNLI